MHYKLFRVITLSARDITLKSDKDGKIVLPHLATKPWLLILDTHAPQKTVDEKNLILVNTAMPIFGTCAHLLCNCKTETTTL